jgi:uncharacterized membrane protein (DUF4010 family)
MYVRILALVAVFNLTLARHLAIPLLSLSGGALLICALQYRGRPSVPPDPERLAVSRNPLELGVAVIFAALFVLTALLSTWVTGAFGIAGVYSLAALIGVTDIDPFVLNLAQGGTSGVPGGAIAAAILIAASSNNLLKAVYAASFGGHERLRLALPCWPPSRLEASRWQSTLAAGRADAENSAAARLSAVWRLSEGRC